VNLQNAQKNLRTKTEICNVTEIENTVGSPQYLRKRGTVALETEIQNAQTWRWSGVRLFKYLNCYILRHNVLDKVWADSSGVYIDTLYLKCKNEEEE